MPNLICPGCLKAFEQEQHISYPSDRKRYPDIKRPTDIYFCPECELGIAYPFLTEGDLEFFYADGNYRKNYQIRIITPSKQPELYMFAETRWEFIKEYFPEELLKSGFSILDIGSGHGFLGMAVGESKKYLFEKFCAVERDRFCRDSLKATWSKIFPNIKLEAVDSLERVKGKFDIIVMSHVLEHINDPQKILKAAVDNLTEKGVVFIDVPCQDYLFKIDVFPHILFFNKKSMEALVKSVGLEPIAIQAFGPSKNKRFFFMNSSKSKLLIFLNLLFFYGSRILPLSITTGFYRWHYKADYDNPDGVWLRTIAVKR